MNIFDTLGNKLINESINLCQGVAIRVLFVKKYLQDVAKFIMFFHISPFEAKEIKQVDK